MSDMDANYQTYDGLAGISRVKPSELAKLIELLPPHGMMLEIGSADGVTAAKIAQAHPGARIISVDPYLGPDVDRERLANWKKNQQHNQHLWLSKLDIFHFVCGQKFDVVLVDGSHRYANVMSDMQYSLTLLKETGILAMHDYGNDDWRQVKQAVDRFLFDYPQLKMELCAELAIVRKA